MAIPPVRRTRRENWAARKGKWSPRGTGNPPILEVRPRLVKTVKIQVKWAAAHPGQDRRLPGVVTHSRLWRATSVRPGERTWLAWSRSGALGAAMRDWSCHHGGIRARTISESKDVFCVFLCACVFVCVSVVVDAVSLCWTARSVNTSKLDSVLVQLCFCFVPFGMRSQSRVPLECDSGWAT